MGGWSSGGDCERRREKRRHIEEERRRRDCWDSVASMLEVWEVEGGNCGLQWWCTVSVSDEALSSLRECMFPGLSLIVQSRLDSESESV